MVEKLSIASEILVAVAFGMFLWGLPFQAAGVAAVGVAVGCYKRVLANKAQAR